ncbi:MAG: hypothetical protein ABEN55_23085 [Bradymonadaceae bacterium]
MFRSAGELVDVGDLGRDIAGIQVGPALPVVAQQFAGLGAAGPTLRRGGRGGDRRDRQGGEDE